MTRQTPPRSALRATLKTGLRICSAILLMMAGLIPAHGTEYHVSPSGDDADPGTAELPWRTIAQANSAALAGDLIWLHAGTYSDPIRPVADGTSNEERIVYRAFGDGDVILIGFNDIGGPVDGALALGEKRYVTVSGHAPGDPPSSQRIRLVPQTDVSLLGNVCGSEGVVVENIFAHCPSSDQNCNRGFGFCINFWDGQYESRFNVLRNSTFLGNSDPGEDPNNFTEDLISMAKEAHHNLIENNVFDTCRHSSLYIDSPSAHSNVIRGNRILNPEHTALSIWSAGVDYAEGARMLIEDNLLSASGRTVDPDGFPGNAFQWGSDELIIRHNVITRGGSVNSQNSSIGGLVGATSTSFGSPYFATDGRIYHNALVDNRGVAIGMMDFGVDPVDLGRHKFVNNFIYGSDSAVTGSLLAVYWDASFATADRYIGNVWGNPAGSESDPILSGAHHGTASLATAVADWRNPADPETTPWAGFENTYDADPGFVDYEAGDVRLKPSSPHIDAAAPLTRVAPGDLETGTVMLLEDTRFFFAEAAEFPPWMGVQPDTVAVGPNIADAERTQLLTVDDETGQVTLARSITREVGDFVWLWRDSAGRELISGSAPDIGPFETGLDIFSDGFESGDRSAWSTTAP